ncbi:MAG: glucuronate isomerase [Lachnospirales bacterium]
MNKGFNEELFLTNKTGSMLYHKYAEKMPIIDYHCHLNPKEMYENEQFEDLGEIWLKGDHYKWRAMRTFGISEKYITGDASYYAKFLKFAEILPLLVGNPLYIWCAMELKRYFGINEPLCEKNAEEIYIKTKDIIVKENINRHWCINKSNVKLISTTEDPIDTLEYHKLLTKENKLKTKVISAFRPDMAMFLKENSFKDYMEKLSKSADVKIISYKDMLKALDVRLKYFKDLGTSVSDNGIPYFKWEDYREEEIETIWAKACNNEEISQIEENKYVSSFLFDIGKMYNKNSFVMQLHIGTYLNTNTKKVEEIGKSTGFDCVDDNSSVKCLGRLLNELSKKDLLPKTILYPLDGTKIEAWSILAAAFCESGIKGKVQLGASWWFNDQVYGIQRQFESCGNLYPVSLSIGMLTDSRSFISYPRHELYRRVFCDYLGKLVERNEYFSDEMYLKKIVEDVCYNNVVDFFALR